ncbi:MAG: diguanylate cyclase [Zoogloeaceae bacterium]|jgi:diguanylate cyclase (GGDEF)-like protein|nr:diguanylate cyclase [Zoogloeaceae bacterium]
MPQESSLHILLVEGAHGSAPDDIAPLRAMLEDAPVTHELAQVNSLEGSLLRMEDGAFDAVLIHLIQPDDCSLKVILRLREHTPEIPVLVVSDLNDDEIALAAVRSGAQDYLVEHTFDANLLLRAIRYAIERNRMQVKLRVLSLLDDLTGVYNRRGFITLAEQQIRISQRSHIGFHLIFIDLDGMKRINDMGGHIAGDRALIAIAQLLSSTFRCSDVVARMGGDEFAVISACDTESQCPDNAAPIIARLEDALARHNKRHPDEPTLSISYGTVFFDPAENKTLEQMLMVADQLMYENKRQKKQQQMATSNFQSDFTESTLFQFGVS